MLLDCAHVSVRAKAYLNDAEVGDFVERDEELATIETDKVLPAFDINLVELTSAANVLGDVLRSM